MAVAVWLERRAGVEKVLYPGLPSHPNHAIAARQMRDFGGMVSFLADSEEQAVDLVARTKLFKLAESLGGVESLIEVPARMTHASTATAPFAALSNGWALPAAFSVQRWRCSTRPPQPAGTTRQSGQRLRPTSTTQ